MGFPALAESRECTSYVAVLQEFVHLRDRVTFGGMLFHGGFLISVCKFWTRSNESTMTDGYGLPNSFEERVSLVHQWQRYYRMEPRSDSKLTQLFASGQVNMFPDQVARELMATDFIYKYTMYGELIEEFMRKVAHRLKEQYDLTWTATWGIVRFYAPVALKLICLLQTGKCIPPCMPNDDQITDARVF